MYTNLTAKPRGGQPFVPSMLFATNDILVFQNELNVNENHLAVQTQLFLSELDMEILIWPISLPKSTI